MAEIIASVPDALEKMQALDLTNLSADQQSWITSTLASPSPVAQIVDFTEGLYSCGTALSADQQSLCAALALYVAAQGWHGFGGGRGAAIATAIERSGGPATSDPAPTMIWVLPTPVQPTLAQTQATQINALNASYQAAITAPISFTTTAGVTATFPQDAQAKTYLNQCLVAGAASKVWPLNLWLDVSGTPVSPFTYADLQNLASAMELAELPEYHDLLTKIAAVQAASTVADVQAITL